MTRKSSLIIVVALFASAIIISSCDNDAITNDAGKVDKIDKIGKVGKVDKVDKVSNAEQARRIAAANNIAKDPETTKAIEELDYKIYADGLTLGIQTAANKAIAKVTAIKPAASLAKEKADALKALTAGTEEEKNTAQEEADDAQKALKLAAQDAIASIDKARLLVASDTTNEADKAVYTALEALRKVVVKITQALKITVVLAPSQTTKDEVTTNTLNEAKAWQRKITEVDEVAKAQTITDAIEEVRTKADAQGVTPGIKTAAENAADGVNVLINNIIKAKTKADELVQVLTATETTEEAKEKVKSFSGILQDYVESGLLSPVGQLDTARLLVASDTTNEADKAVYTALVVLRKEIVKIAQALDITVEPASARKTGDKINAEQVRAVKTQENNINEADKIAKAQTIKDVAEAVRTKAAATGVTPGIKTAAEIAAKQADFLLEGIEYAKTEADALLIEFETPGTTETAKNEVQNRLTSTNIRLVSYISNAISRVDDARILVVSDTTNEADKAVYTALVVLRKEIVKIAQALDISVEPAPAQKTEDRINVEKLRAAKARANILIEVDKIAKTTTMTAAIQEVRTKAAATGVTPDIKDAAENAANQADILIRNIADAKTKTDALVTALTTAVKTEEEKNTAQKESNNASSKITAYSLIESVDNARLLVVSGTTNSADENVHTALDALRLKLVEIREALGQHIEARPARKTVTERLKAAKDWASTITKADKIAKAKTTTDALGTVRDKAAATGVTPDIKDAAADAARFADSLLGEIGTAKTKADALVTALTTTGTTETEKNKAQTGKGDTQLRLPLNISYVISWVDDARILVVSDTTNEADKAVYTALVVLRKEIVKIAQALDISVEPAPAQKTEDRINVEKLRAAKARANMLIEAGTITKATTTTAAIQEVRTKAAATGVTPFIKDAAENAAKEADLLVKNIADAKTKTDALVTALTTTGTTEEEKNTAQKESDNAYSKTTVSYVIGAVDAARLLVVSGTTNTADEGVHTALDALRLKLVDIADALSQNVEARLARKTGAGILKAAKDWASKITAADKIAKAKTTTDTLGAVRDKAAATGVTPDIKTAAERAADHTYTLTTNIGNAKIESDELVNALETPGTTETAKHNAQQDSDSRRNSVLFNTVLYYVDAARRLIESDTDNEADKAVYKALDALRTEIVKINKALGQ